MKHSYTVRRWAGMRQIAYLLAVCAGILVATSRVYAADADFVSRGVVGVGRIYWPTSAAMSDAGAYAVLASPLEDGRIEVVTRQPDHTWNAPSFVGAHQPRGVRAAVNGRGTVVVTWTERRPSERVAVATGSSFGPLRVVARVPVGSAASSQPRLATLIDGRVLLAFRNGSHLIVAPVLTDGLGVRRAIADGAHAFVLAAAGLHGALVWMVRGHTLQARLVRGDATPSGRAIVVSRDATGTPRVAGSGEGNVIASWLRPPHSNLQNTSVTRALWPALRPPRRLLLVGSGVPLAVPAVAIAPDGGAAAAVLVGGTVNGPSFGVLAATSTFGGVWTRRAVVPERLPKIGTIDAVALAGRRSLTIYSAAGQQRFDVHVVDRAADGTILGSQTFPGAPDSPAGLAARGIGIAHAGTHVLVAYGAPDGGFAVAERD